MTNPLLEARNLMQRDQYIDGLSEISAGTLLTLLAGMIFVSIWHHDTRPIWLLPIILFFMLSILAFAVFQKRVLRAIRSRISYSRTGYVRYREPGKIRIVVLVALFALSQMAVGVISYRFRGQQSTWNPELWYRALPALTGILSSISQILFSLRTGLYRFLLVAVFSSSLGVAISFAWNDPKQGVSVFFAGMGCIFVLSGGITLWRYLQSPRVPEENA